MNETYYWLPKWGFQSPVQDAAAAAALAAKGMELNDPQITAKPFQRCDIIHPATLEIVSGRQPQLPAGGRRPQTARRPGARP